MIIGTVCLILAVVGVVVVVPSGLRAFRTDSSGALILFLGCLAVLYFGLVLGLTTYECAPGSPLFQSFGLCQSGVPWP